MVKTVCILMALLLFVATVLPTPAMAISGACEQFATTVTNSWSQSYWYLMCQAEMSLEGIYYFFEFGIW